MLIQLQKPVNLLFFDISMGRVAILSMAATSPFKTHDGDIDMKDSEESSGMADGKESNPEVATISQNLQQDQKTSSLVLQPLEGEKLSSESMTKKRKLTVAEKAEAQALKDVEVHSKAEEKARKEDAKHQKEEEKRAREEEKRLKEEERRIKQEEARKEREEKQKIKDAIKAEKDIEKKAKEDAQAKKQKVDQKWLVSFIMLMLISLNYASGLSSKHQSLMQKQQEFLAEDLH